MPNKIENSRTVAHRQSVTITPTDLVTALCDKLGPKSVAYIVDRDASSISRWKSGASDPGEAALRPLRVTYQVFQMLEGLESDHTIRAWFMGTNPQLDDESPLEAVREGRNREVLAAARAFVTGG
jgi:hypothetical protein